MTLWKANPYKSILKRLMMILDYCALSILFETKIELGYLIAEAFVRKF